MEIIFSINASASNRPRKIVFFFAKSDPMQIFIMCQWKHCQLEKYFHIRICYWRHLLYYPLYTNRKIIIFLALCTKCAFLCPSYIDREFKINNFTTSAFSFHVICAQALWLPSHNMAPLSCNGQVLTTMPPHRVVNAFSLMHLGRITHQYTY